MDILLKLFVVQTSVLLYLRIIYLPIASSFFAIQFRLCVNASGYSNSRRGSDDIGGCFVYIM